MSTGSMFDDPEQEDTKNRQRDAKQDAERAWYVEKRSQSRKYHGAGDGKQSESYHLLRWQ